MGDTYGGDGEGEGGTEEAKVHDRGAEVRNLNHLREEEKSGGASHSTEVVSLPYVRRPWHDHAY